MISRKFGVAALIVGLIIAMGAFGLGATTRVAQADPTSASCADPTLSNAQTTLCSAVFFEGEDSGNDDAWSVTASGALSGLAAVACWVDANDDGDFVEEFATDALGNCDLIAISGTDADAAALDDDSTVQSWTLFFFVTGSCSTPGGAPEAGLITVSQHGVDLPIATSCAPPAAGPTVVVCGDDLSDLSDDEIDVEAALVVEDIVPGLVKVDISTLEINPAPGSTSNAHIRVDVTSTLTEDVEGIGEDGDVVVLCTEVIGIATTGVIETGDVNDEDDFTDSGIFNVFGTGSCAQIEDPNDTNVLQEEVQADEILEDEDGDPYTEADFVYCASAGSTLGPTTVTFIVHVDEADIDDIIVKVNFTIVGPPATLTIDASPKTLVCGEKATFTGTVKDAIAQNVSNGTPVDVWTNFGGVTIPSSTTNTFGIQGATATGGGAYSGFLLTSTTNEGPYEVVARVATGIPGVYLYAQTTVTCAKKAAAAPAVGAPATGTGGSLGAPSTGDAGLADAGNSSVLFSIAGAVAFAIAGVATLRFARR